MFGKPEWFQEKSTGWGLQPQSWRGWAYAAGWVGAIAIPFASLVFRHQGLEAVIWLFTGIGLLGWDVAEIRRSLRQSLASNVLYIREDGECSPLGDAPGWK